jgi:hypothetical protein
MSLHLLSIASGEHPDVRLGQPIDAYFACCTKHGYVPLSPQKLAAELAAMGFTKWKSCGRMRYRDLQFVA